MAGLAGLDFPIFEFQFVMTSVVLCAKFVEHNRAGQRLLARFIQVWTAKSPVLWANDNDFLRYYQFLSMGMKDVFCSRSRSHRAATQTRVAPLTACKEPVRNSKELLLDS